MVKKSTLKLNPVFSENMMIQRNKDICIWGTAVAGMEISVCLAGQIVKTVCSENGCWEALLKPVSEKGPFKLIVSATEQIEINNIVFGDVWLCAGQSNMEMPVDGWGRVFNYAEVLRNACNNNIRLSKVPNKTALKPVGEFEQLEWNICAGKSIADFSAAAYFFAEELISNGYGPIGLIQAAWSGTKIQPWMSESVLSGFDEFERDLNDAALDAEYEKELAGDFCNKLQNWLADYDKMDKGFEDIAVSCYDLSSENTCWNEIILPSMWNENGLGDFSGSLWYKKDFLISENFISNEMFVNTGPVNFSPDIWINGKKINALVNSEFPRNYAVNESCFSLGKNTITIRVQAEEGRGGFWGEAEELFIKNDQDEKILLSGKWICRKGADLNDLPARPFNPVDVCRPGVIYNGMIAPLTKLNIAGILWYQGESNVGEAEKYKKYFKKNIEDWRQKFNDKNLPFIFVQLANYNDKNFAAGDIQIWPWLREAQASARELENVGMAVAIDIGESEDIHPRNKREVGKRMALLARKIKYDEKIFAESPEFKSLEIKSNKVYLSFENIADGLQTKNKQSIAKGFEVAGSNKIFKKASAEIINNEIIVWADEIDNPMAVRYAWANDPDCNVYNSAGLPLVPFRTDNWKL